MVVVVGGGTTGGSARLLSPEDPGHGAALAAYRRRWPQARPSVIDPLVVVEPHGAAVTVGSGTARDRPRRR